MIVVGMFMRLSVFEVRVLNWLVLLVLMEEILIGIVVKVWFW